MSTPSHSDTTSPRGWCYIDNDPLVLAHGRALLAEDGRTTVVAADIGDPSAVIDHPDTQRLIDFSRPVAVLLRFRI